MFGKLFLSIYNLQKQKLLKNHFRIFPLVLRDYFNKTDKTSCSNVSQTYSLPKQKQLQEKLL